MSHLPDPDDRLDSWKEIARFLGRTVRTVQRWERSVGLPVRRGRPGQRRAIVASKSELREWWTVQRPVLEREDSHSDGYAHASSRLLLRCVAFGILIVLAIGGSDGRGRPAVRLDTPIPIGRILATVSSEGTHASFVDLNASPTGLAVSPAGDRIFVALHEADAVAVVDLARGVVLDRIPVVQGPGPVALSADGNQLFVAGDFEVGVLDFHSRELARIRTGTLAEDVALSADGRRLWVALGHGGLKILDTQSLRLDDYPSVGCPKRLALARGMARLFVAYQCGGPGGRAGHDALEIIDEPTRRSVLARSGLPLVGSYLAVSPDEQVLWADAHDACISAAYDHIGCPAVPSMVIHALRPTTLELLTSFALPPDRSDSFPVFVPDGSRVIVGASGVSVLNARLGQVEEHFPGDSVAEAAFSPDSRALVVGFTNQRGLMIARVHDRLDARRIDGIGSYWPGDGSSADVVGGMHAVQTEGIVFRPGRLGQAFAFDGQRSTMHFGNRLEVDIHREPATYAAWVRSAAPERTMTLLSRPGHAGWEIRLLAGGRLAFCFSVAAGALACDRGGVSASVPMTQGWHHIAVVRDATSLKLYVDGRLVADHSLAGYANPVVANDDPAPITRLGADIDGTSRFAGLVDEVALFRRALTAGDIAELMSATTLKR